MSDVVRAGAVLCGEGIRPEGASAKGDAGDNVKYSDFSAFYAPSVGEQIANWYANK